MTASLVLCVLVLLDPGVHAWSPSMQAGRLGRQHSWSARTSDGRTFAGTWTFEVDKKTGAVTGTWTLSDAQGRAVAGGGWSAAKSPKGWTGAWRAVATGSTVEYSGTWSAAVELKPDAGFADLFTLAVKEVVGGTWRAAGRSGAWSIRVFE